MHTLAINYIIFSVYIVLLYIINNNDNKFVRINSREKVFVILSFFTLIFLHVNVNRDSVEDLPNYYETFSKISQVKFSEIFQQIRNTDYSYAIFNKLCSLISNDFKCLLFIYNIILLGSHYLIAKKYSPYLPISIALFLLISYNQSLFVIRQYLAISVLLWSIPCILNKKIVPYIILSIIAFFFHSSSIIWFPLYFIYNIRNKKKFLVSIILMIVSISYLCSNPANLIMLLGLEFESYVRDDVGMNLTMKLIPFMYLLCYCIFLGKHIFDEGINKLCFIALLIYTVIFFFAPPVGLIDRILKYYETLSFLSVPITMYYCKLKQLSIPYFISILVFQGYLTAKSLNEFYFVDYYLDECSFILLLFILISVWLLVYVINKCTYNGPFIQYR